jgi:hypothetical protein
MVKLRGNTPSKIQKTVFILPLWLFLRTKTQP